jgi:hypothetical protein
MDRGGWLVLGIACVVAACSSEGGESRDSLSAEDASHCRDGKCTICHVPPGNPANAHTITVGAPAVRAHLAHGDRRGFCGGAACETVFRDRFERPDDDALGNNEVPGTAWSEIQGDVDVLGGALVMAANASANSWAVASQGATISDTAVRLRFRVRFDSSIHWTFVTLNDTAIENPAGNALGIGVGLYASGGGNYARIMEGGATVAEIAQAGLLAGVDHFVELGLQGSLATLRIAKDAYPGSGGTITHTLTGTLARSGTGTFVKVGLDHNAQVHVRLHEVSVERGACDDSPPPAETR